MSHDRAQILLDELVLPFYAVERDMLVPPDNARDENDAEHSWSLAVVACSLAEHIDPTLDVGLVAQFSLVHDLTEIGAGDTSVWAEDYELADKDERETKALETFRVRFANFPWLVEMLDAYERLDTNEARYVKAMDKYIALCMRIRDGGEFFHIKHITKKIFERKLITHRQKAHFHPGVAEYYEKLRAEYEQHPEFFYHD